jgi:hypothetical protein
MEHQSKNNSFVEAQYDTSSVEAKYDTSLKPKWRVAKYAPVKYNPKGHSETKELTQQRQKAHADKIESMKGNRRSGSYCQ